MKCPACNSNLSFLDTFKILNPHKFKCMYCGVFLALDKTGVIVLYLYALVGAGMLGFYFYLIDAHIGTPIIRGGIFFGYLLPATIAFYWAMAKLTHLVRRNET